MICSYIVEVRLFLLEKILSAFLDTLTSNSERKTKMENGLGLNNTGVEISLL